MPDAEPTIQRLRALALEQRTRRLIELARTVVDGERPGDHRDRGRGDGVDFAEHRPYTAGDELRIVDWRATARTDRVVVRQFETARATTLELLVDVSRSMEFGSVEPDSPLVPASKSEAAVMAAAVHGYAALRRGDGVALTLVGARPMARPSRRGEAQLTALCADLAAALPAGEPRAALAEAVARASSRSSPGRILVLTDALDEDDGWLDDLARARTRGHGVAVLQVVDPEERELGHERAAEFVDPESSRRVTTDPTRVRRLYCALFEAFVEGIRQRLLSAGGDHALVLVGRPVSEAVPRREGRG
jgi:uncharacterized protein (DUF58 family)